MKKEDEEVVLNFLMKYETGNSWFIPFCKFEWMQELASYYFSNKVSRKLKKIHNVFKNPIMFNNKKRIKELEI